MHDKNTWMKSIHKWNTMEMGKIFNSPPYGVSNSMHYQQEFA
jgi:hypothetical protein